MKFRQLIRTKGRVYSGIPGFDEATSPFPAVHHTPFTLEPQRQGLIDFGRDFRLPGERVLKVGTDRKQLLFNNSNKSSIVIENEEIVATAVGSLEEERIIRTQ